MPSILEPSRAHAGSLSVDEGLEHLVEASKAVLRVLETDQLLEVLMERTLELSGADRGFLMLAEDDELRFRTGRSFDRSQLEADDRRISLSVAEEVFRTRKPILSTDVLGDDGLNQRRSVLELRLQTIMCVPLIARDRPLGVLYVDSNRLRRDFDATLLRVFQGLADLAAIALENARLFELATTDAKTGLADAGLFESRLGDAVATASSGAGQVGLVLLDLDHFKRLNDTHGHPAGDRVLVAIAERLRASIRDGDLAARYGGEEFALLLRSTSERPTDFAAIAERARRAIEACTPTLDDGTVMKVTASFGVACYPATEIHDAAGLIACADRRMYRAKHLGRNRVVSS